MDLHRLRLLLEFSRRGTVAGVAASLSFSPSSVSVQLRELEREAGVPLLRQVGRRLELTDAGHAVVAHAAEALAADEAVRSRIAAMGEAPSGPIRVSFMQSTAMALLPRLLDALSVTAPGLQVAVHHLETRPALEELEGRGLDVVVGGEYDEVPVPRLRGIVRHDLLREQIPLVLAATQRSGDNRPIQLSSLRGMAWASGHAGTGHAALVEHACRRLGGFEPEIRHRTNDVLILGMLAASGRAATFLPALVATAVPGVVTAPIEGWTSHRTIFAAVRDSSAGAPMIVAVLAALHDAAVHAAAGRTDVQAPGAGART